MGHFLSISYPPAPKFTEKNLPDLQGKVYIVTGSTSGVGQELARILYLANAKVYVAGRSAANGAKAIEYIKEKTPESQGELVFLHLDLNDLNDVKKSADEFLAKEKRLDVLINNAGVMTPPQGSKTAQGSEIAIGPLEKPCLKETVAPFLFTKLLTPLLLETANTGADTRVVWVASSAAEAMSPKNGVDMSNLDYKIDQGAWHKYGTSKAGTYYNGVEYAKRNPTLKSLVLNPGNLRTPLQRHMPWWQVTAALFLMHEPVYGAYTELFAGLSPDITLEKSGSWIQPWGRIFDIRADLVLGTKTEAEGGTGIAERFWDWSEDQVKPYL